MRLVSIALAALTISAIACKREPAGSPAVEPRSQAMVIEVVDDPAAVDAARRAYHARREQLFQRLVSDPAIIRDFEIEDMAILRARREEAVAALAAMRDNSSQPAAKRVQAVIALHLLDALASPQQLVELAATDTEATLALLHRLDDVAPRKQPPSPPIRQFLISATSHDDPRVWRSALTYASSHKLDEAGEPILARLERGVEDQDQQILLRAAARIRPTRRVVDLLIALVQRDTRPLNSSSTLLALAEAAKGTADPEARRLAASAVVEYLIPQPDHPWIDSGTASAIARLGELPPPQNSQTLAELVRNMKWRAMRDQAIRALAKFDPAGAKQIAAEVGASLPTAPPTTSASPQPTLTMHQAADICVRHGVLDRAEADRTLVKLQERNDRSSAEDYLPSSGALVLLYAAKRFYFFDTETGTVPNRHDLLIEELASKSAGRFSPEAMMETYTTETPDAETGVYEVQFVHAGRLYRFKPNDLGDWYDVEAVLSAIDRALRDAGESQRFVLLQSEGQEARVVFANPQALAQAAAELGLILGDDPGEARRLGKEFEQKAIRSLQDH